MLIGELADSAGVPARTVRFYERRRLLPKPARADNGYRVYGQESLERLRFIRAAQRAGLTLAEIASIIDLRDQGTTPCGHVENLLLDKLADVRRKRCDLAVLEADLEALIARSRRLDPSDCSASAVCHILQTSADSPC